MKQELVSYILDNHEKMVMFARTFTKRNREKAEDCVQDAITYILAKTDLPEFIEHIPTYATNAIKNCCRNHITVNKKYLHTEDGLGEITDDYNVDYNSVNDYTETLEEGILYKEIMDFAKTLPPMQYKSILDTLKADNTMIAVDGKSKETNKAARYIAIQKIRKHFRVV